jgi:hypothetical protein
MPGPRGRVNSDRASPVSLVALGDQDNESFTRVSRLQSGLTPEQTYEYD